MSRKTPTKIPDWQKSYFYRAARIKRSLSVKALARRFGCAERTVSVYMQRGMRQ
jgi:hypothetical protein